MSRIPQHKNDTAMRLIREKEMSHPDPGHPAEANGAYPYELPVHDSASTGTGTGMPRIGTRQYQEWHHADPPSRGAGGGTPGRNPARHSAGPTRVYS